MMKDNPYPGADDIRVELNELYRQGAREMPPAHIDAQILTLASTRGETAAPLHSTRKPTRRLPYVVSTAASVLLLAGIFFINPELVQLGLHPGEPVQDLPAPAAMSVAEEDSAYGQPQSEALAQPRENPASAMMKMAPAPESVGVVTDGIETELQGLEAALAHQDKVGFALLLEQFERHDYPLTDEQRQRLERLKREGVN